MSAYYRFPLDFIEGVKTSSLSLEQIALYDHVLDRIYEDRGPFDVLWDGDRTKRLFGWNMRGLKSRLNELERAGKIWLSCNSVHNPRAEMYFREEGSGRGVPTLYHFADGRRRPPASRKFRVYYWRHPEDFLGDRRSMHTSSMGSLRAEHLGLMAILEDVMLRRGRAWIMDDPNRIGKYMGTNARKIRRLLADLVEYERMEREGNIVRSPLVIWLLRRRERMRHYRATQQPDLFERAPA